MSSRLRGDKTMENVEKKTEQKERSTEKENMEQQRREARMAAEERNSRHDEHREEMKQNTEKKSLSTTDRAEARPIDRHRIENLRTELRRIEADREWAKDGKVRQREGSEMGKKEHELDAQTLRLRESAKGRVEGKDFDVEIRLKHPDGKKTERLDYVNYQKDIVADHKPIGVNDTPEKVMNKSDYRKQRERQIEAYEHTTGRKVKEYHYSLYPSMKDYHEHQDVEISPVKEIIIKRDENGKEDVFVEYRTDKFS